LRAVVKQAIEYQSAITALPSYAV